MGSTQGENDLSIRDIEELLLEKRRRLTENTVQRFLDAEASLPRQVLPDAAQGMAEISPPRSPETWRGDEGGDRYFGSTAMQPLRAPAPTKAPQDEPKAETARPPERPRRLRDALVFIGELAILVALVVLLVRSYEAMQTLNREARAAQRQALLQSVVPSTSVPTGRPAGALASSTKASSGVAMAPDATATPLRAMAAAPRDDTKGQALPLPISPSPAGTPAAEPTAAPTPGASAGIPRRLVIEKLGVDSPVVQGDDWEALTKGVGHHPGSANAGEAGNLVLSAHNDIYGEIFRQLHTLEPGDEAIVYTDGAAFRYVVSSQEIVLPTRIEVLEQTDEPILTMITCYPYLLDTHRVVVVAQLVEDAPQTQ
jgi:sortase A